VAQPVAIGVLGDSPRIQTNHSCITSTQSALTSTSSNVWINAKAVILAGDSTEIHGTGLFCGGAHAPTLSSQDVSQTVFIHGLGVARVGDGYSINNGMSPTIPGPPPYNTKADQLAQSGQRGSTLVTCG